MLLDAHKQPQHSSSNALVLELRYLCANMIVFVSQSVLYFPADPPNRLFQTGPLESGVSLHSRRVLVKKSASDLLPKWLWFLRGVVDCEDMPLNVSREHVQDTQLQRKLASVIVKRILKFLNEQVSTART